LAAIAFVFLHGVDVMSFARHALVLLLVAFLAPIPRAAAAAVSPEVERCVIRATRAAVANRNNRAAMASLYDRYLGDSFARQAAKPGNWDRFSAEEKANQRAWAKQRTLAAIPRFLSYASADIKVLRQQGRAVYGRAILPKNRGSTSLTWYLAGGCRFYDLHAGGYSLSQLVGSYQRGKRK
jgi:hypothetical protein